MCQGTSPAYERSKIMKSEQTTTTRQHKGSKSPLHTTHHPQQQQHHHQGKRQFSTKQFNNSHQHSTGRKQSSTANTEPRSAINTFPQSAPIAVPVNKNRPHHQGARPSPPLKQNGQAGSSGNGKGSPRQSPCPKGVKRHHQSPTFNMMAKGQLVPPPSKQKQTAANTTYKGPLTISVPVYAGAKFSDPPSPKVLPKPPTHWVSGASAVQKLMEPNTCRQMTDSLKMMLNVQA